MKIGEFKKIKKCVRGIILYLMKKRIKDKRLEVKKKKEKIERQKKHRLLNNIMVLSLFLKLVRQKNK